MTDYESLPPEPAEDLTEAEYLERLKRNAQQLWPKSHQSGEPVREQVDKAVEEFTAEVNSYKTPQGQSQQGVPTEEERRARRGTLPISLHLTPAVIGSWVEVGGEQVGQCRAVSVSASLGQPLTVELTLMPREAVEVAGEALVQPDAATRALLVKLGWIPPERAGE